MHQYTQATAMAVLRCILSGCAIVAVGAAPIDHDMQTSIVLSSKVCPFR